MAMAMAMADGAGAGGAGGGGGTELTGISFRDQLWLNSFPLERALVFDYFALSPFYDPTCNNQTLRMRSIHPLDISHLSKMIGMEYMLYEVQEPNFFVFRKQKRESPEKVTPTSAYYILDGSIYQAPNIHNVIGSRVVRSLYHIAKAFSEASTKLEKIGYDSESAEGLKADSKGSDDSRKGAEMFNVKEALRVDHILNAIHRKLPPAPAPPPLMPIVAADTAPTSQNEGVEGPPAQQATSASASGGPDASTSTVLGKQQQKVASVDQPPAKRVKPERL